MRCWENTGKGSQTRSSCRTVSFQNLGCIYLHCGKEDFHASGTAESLPARPDVGDVFEAQQETPTDVDVAVGDVALVPVLIQPQKSTQVASVHHPPTVGLWNHKKKASHH